MVRRNSAPQPIGPGRAGTLKRAVYKGGGGKKTLKTLRSAPKELQRAVVKTPGVKVRALAKSYRETVKYYKGRS